MKSAVATSDLNDTLDFGLILEDLVSEINHAAQSCTALQWTISSLLEKVNHPDLAAEIHMLQDIDRLQQTLADIAAILETSSPAARGILLSRQDVGASIRLESLRYRLRLGGIDSSTEHSSADMDQDDITWL